MTMTEELKLKKRICETCGIVMFWTPFRVWGGIWTHIHNGALPCVRLYEAEAYKRAAEASRKRVLY